MSQIFDALQRSETERSGVGFADLPAATDVLEAAERQAAQAATTVDCSPANEGPSENDQRTQGVPAGSFPQFESVRAVISAQSRLVCVTEEESLAAEKFRFLGVRLRHIQQKRSLKRILITSSMAEEGKSTVAANLVCTLASRHQQRVLLVEGDLRRPSLAERFGVAQLPGLSELLEAGTNPTKNIYKLEGLGFWFLPAGSPPRGPLELMQSGKLALLMDQLASWFDWIVIDSPPLLPLADTSVWMRLSDSVLLVTRPGKTGKHQLQRALETVEQSKVLGALVNGSREASLGGYDRYYGGKKTVLSTPSEPAK